VRESSKSRKLRERDFRAELLLDAAENVFVERGFAGASVEEIARRGEVALATLYKAFSSKEAMFVRVIERWQVRFRERLDRASAVGLPLARVESLVRESFAFVAEHGGVFQMWIAATQSFPWQIRAGLGEEVYGRYREFLGHVEALCRAALPLARRKRARVVAIALVGTVNGMLAEWIASAPGKRPDAEAAASEVWDVVRRLIAS
jgi:AcrR family transcriptional regulator